MSTLKEDCGHGVYVPCLNSIVSLFHMMPDLGSQFHCTLYTFIVLGKIIYSNIFYGIVFYCIVVLLCSNILLF